MVEELSLAKNPLRSIPDNAFQSFGRYMEKLNLDGMGLEKVSLILLRGGGYFYGCSNNLLSWEG